MKHSFEQDHHDCVRERTYFGLTTLCPEVFPRNPHHRFVLQVAMRTHELRIRRVGNQDTRNA